MLERSNVLAVLPIENSNFPTLYCGRNRTPHLVIWPLQRVVDDQISEARKGLSAVSTAGLMLVELRSA